MSSFNRGLSTGNAKIDHKLKNIGKKSINSTAGAVVSKNEKGETTMEKVKVKRYVAGKMPEFKYTQVNEILPLNQLESLKTNIKESLEEKINEFNIDDNNYHNKIVHKNEIKVSVTRISKTLDHCNDDVTIKQENELYDDEAKIDDDSAVIHRQLIKEKILARQHQDTVVNQHENLPNIIKTLEKSKLENDNRSIEDDDDDEYEYYSSEEEYFENDNIVPRLKPVFVRKEDRVTVNNPDNLIIDKDIQHTAIDDQLVVERRKESRKMVAAIRKEEMVDEQNVESYDQVVITDDEDDEAEFELWKLRELKRMKRDIEERQQMENEKIELEKIRNMSEQERIQYFEQNPKIISNKSIKGQYKFLQKYFHRGAYFLDQDDDIFKRNFDEPTLEDHFDKSVLPSYLQIKNFGKAGRTKYTHLTDQDTTDHLLNRDEASASIPQFQKKFHEKISAGSKSTFEKPSFRRKHKLDD